jgi:hypothetical protein
MVGKSALWRTVSVQTELRQRVVDRVGDLGRGFDQRAVEVEEDEVVLVHESVQGLPFALSLSKGSPARWREGFDKLSPNGFSFMPKAVALLRTRAQW